MDFIEIAVVGIAGEAAEAVGDVFNRYGYGGAVIESHAPTFDRVTVRTVVPSTNPEQVHQIEVVLALMSQVLPGGLPEPQRQTIGETDWAESWKAHFHPIRIGRRFVIKPSWREYPAQPQDIIIEIDPGLAFGSGLHPTTQLCITTLEDMPLAGRSLFDVGTGSGVLSLVASKLGATPIRAVDIDAVAVRVAEENFARNDTLTIETAVGSAAEAGGRTWDIVVANILAPILIELMPDLAKATARQLLLSGMLNEQEPDVTAAAAAQHLKVVQRATLDDWVALVVQPV